MRSVRLFIVRMKQMMHKLRILYDHLYIAGETAVKAYQDRRSLRQILGHPKRDARIEQAYRNEIRPYWRQFRVRAPGKLWYYRYCAAHKILSPQYIPDTLWHRRIIPYFNDLLLARAWQDKCMQSVLVPGIRQPETLVKNIAGVYYDDGQNMLTEEQAVRRCMQAGRILAKPSMGSGGGANIRFYDSDTLTEQAVLEIFQMYGRNFLIQKKAAQHRDLAKLNPSSLNTVRVVTFLYDGRVRPISTIIRMGGARSEVDNVSQGGFQCTIRPDGSLEQYGYTHVGNVIRYTETSPSGVRFADVTVPSFDRILQTVCDHAGRMAHFRIIGWDISVAPDGEPMLIEFNLVPALNQETDGPMFGELTDRVLGDVLGLRKQQRRVP